MNSWKLSAPEIAAVPLTGTGGDSVGSDTYYGTQISPVQVDTRAFPSGYGMTNSSALSCTIARRRRSWRSAYLFYGS